MTGVSGPSIAQLGAAAERAMREGRVPEAIDAHIKLLAVEPSLPDSWFNLGWLQRSAGRHEDAIASYAKAIEHGARGIEEIYLNRAVILSEYLNRVDEALEELEK